MADLIGDARLDTWLEARAWSRSGEALEREWSFADFAGALAFVNAVGGLAEAQGHHPDITLHDFNQVRLRLSTHSAGGVTENDLELAERVDELQ
ncbi:4a-hydroxytetrahydrobiopterin dehydratase [Patulibacter sp.]|uniref:4a-hydroxytetrahydrobiopterin dehydratase n=1 Tax=Patulibacter sp. TaxID=1912859 RepID=UPI00272011B2|nr:4a-hydroxytetrahydrobiopterin dehydratase [Patulibacter sp.]MDO9408670.1 4a-hydroxytetrahydrobiopterin dehydratase [Patulibacter sp.]